MKRDYFQDLEVYEKIAICRKAAKMTQNELAQKLGISQKDISRYERNVRSPKLKRLKEMAKVFGIDYRILT